MVLDNTGWFLIGALFILCLYFFTYYLNRKSEKYNLYFAIGCLLGIIRVISYNLIGVMDPSSVYYAVNIKIDHLTFILGPFIYILLADSLFPKISSEKILRVFWIVVAAISALIIFVPMELFPYGAAYDFIIVACLTYATYICTAAWVLKRQFALPIFIANVIFIFGVLHDVLMGSGYIHLGLGEMFGYAYLAYLCIVAVVSARKHLLTDKMRLESQINFLHAQIKPHFLYNTINTIMAYSRTDPEKSRELLAYLSTYLRGKLNSGKDIFIFLQDEMELIQSYLAIEQVRFSERLAVEYDIDEECNILIPGLILQPIVENAVKHGLAPKKEGGKIKISVKKEGENVVIRITDNGVGMDIKKLPDIMGGERGGIGLGNTNERLKRYYNTQIKAVSRPGEGTEVTIVIPMNRSKKHE